MSQRYTGACAVQFNDVFTLRPGVYATHTAMASGKKSALLSSLADYGDDSEPDSDPEPEETGIYEQLE